MVERSADSDTHDRAASAAGFTRFATRGTHRLAYELVPARAMPPGPPVVLLLHALLAGRGEWDTVRAALAGSSVLILPEARGHGASAALTDRRHDLANLAADALAVLDHAGVAPSGHRVHVVGHGLGGAVAWEVARTDPARVASLVLVEPDLPAVLDGALDPLAGTARREAHETDRAAADAAYQGLTDKALDAYLAPRRGAGWRDDLPRPELAALRRHAGALAAVLPALDAYSPSFAAGTGTPTLIVHGDAARPRVRLTCERLAALTGTRLATVPTYSPNDSPLAGPAGETLAALLAAFLSEPDPGTGP
jgi:pimeloyl-ACP methyl ester carboxylesterase